jgi:hypothetical protein
MYQRIEHRDGYDIITTVDENGDYEQITKWLDGTIHNQYRSNIFTMGWHTLKEFLSERKNFVKV